MPNEKKQTYDFVCFTDLIYEFNITEKKKIEAKIKRRLKYHHLGEYKQERIDYIRQLRDDLHDEIGLSSKSKYFHDSKSTYSDLSDFNTTRMTTDYSKKYSKVKKGELGAMIDFAIYYFYLR